MTFLPLPGCPAASADDESPMAGGVASRPMRDARGVCGIVLAGTHHWGDGAFERVLRGPLLPIAHTPLIEYPLQWLRDAGIASVVLCANSATQSLRTVLGDGTPDSMSLTYFEDDEPRGPAGCARDAALMTSASTFIVIEGTIIPTLDFGALIDAHRTSQATATVVVEFDRRRRGMASGVRRQPAGIYVFEREALTSVAQHGYQDIKEGLLGRLNGEGEHVAMHEVHGLSAKVLDYASYAAVSRWLVSRSIERPVFLPSYTRVGEGMFHPSAKVHRSASIIGPVLLGEGVIVEEGAIVVGPASVGARSIISSNAIVSRSFIWDDCVIGAGSTVDSSLLADRSVVVAGDQLKNATVVDSSLPVGPPPPDVAEATMAMEARMRTGGTAEGRRSNASGALGNNVRSARISESLT